MREIKIKTAEELSRLFNALAKEIVDANIYYQLFFGLTEEQQSSKIVFNQSCVFWSLTFDALKEAILIRLCRVYDQESSSLNLVNLLLTIQSNLHFFEEQHFRDRLHNNAFVDSLTKVDRMPSKEDINADIKYASNENQLVKKLTLWRGNIIAHRGAKISLGKVSVLEDNPLPWTEVKELLDKGFEIYNRYSSLYDASTCPLEIVGYDDYQSLLAFANLGLDKYQHDIEIDHRRLRGHEIDNQANQP
jgi:AbiU2